MYLSPPLPRAQLAGIDWRASLDRARASASAIISGGENVERAADRAAQRIAALAHVARSLATVAESVGQAGDALGARKLRELSERARVGAQLLATNVDETAAGVRTTGAAIAGATKGAVAGAAAGAARKQLPPALLYGGAAIGAVLLLRAVTGGR